MHQPNQQRFFSFSRYPLLEGATPIQELTQLNKRLNGVRIFVKRDDLMGIGMGGSKLRKLEFLIADAISKKTDYIITTGARQSNHARLTAAAAAKAGLPCELILTRTVPITTVDYTDNGNIVLDTILGAHIHDLPQGANVQEFADRRMIELRAAGASPYFIPTGGSNAIGCLGYANCAWEILQQTKETGIDISHVVVPNGSSGTHAGLLAGFLSTEVKALRVKSYNVLAPAADALNNTYEKAVATLQLINETLKVSKEAIDIEHSYLGEGYGIPTPEMKQALILLARTEGLLLDPVYSGKAFAGLLGDIEKGVFPPRTNILFIMTGGLPGLFAYRSIFEGL